jgi:hypothetical protein
VVPHGRAIAQRIKEAIERFVMDGTPIPQSIIDEREELKTQYHNTINSL